MKGENQALSEIITGLKNLKKIFYRNSSYILFIMVISTIFSSVISLFFSKYGILSSIIPLIEKYKTFLLGIKNIDALLIGLFLILSVISFLLNLINNTKIGYNQNFYLYFLNSKHVISLLIIPWMIIMIIKEIDTHAIIFNDFDKYLSLIAFFIVIFSIIMPEVKDLDFDEGWFITFIKISVPIGVLMIMFGITYLVGIRLWN